MTRLVLVETKKSTNTPAADANLTEGEQAKRLLEAHGYLPRRQATQNGQWEFPCPFHEESGTVAKNKGTNFYLAAKTSQYYCQAGSCGEQGNLQTLQKFFGVEADPVLASKFKSKDVELQEFEAALTGAERDFLHKDKGLTDDTISKFRIGYDRNRSAYVIPYLEARRPVAFRFYDPVKRGEDDKGKAIYGGPNGSKYWWEKADASVVPQDENLLRLFNSGAANGEADTGQVFICEGEFKAMLLAQWGYAAVAIAGVGGFKQEWARFFMHAKQIMVLMDNDNPEVHQKANCRKCSTVEREECAGHNPGQDAAARLLDFFGYRGKNVLLPLPDGMPKTDINEYVMRDGNGKNDFVRLLLGGGPDSPFAARSLSEIRKNPPPEAVFLVSGGLLPRGGRLLVTGAPKVGKSIFVENLVLSIAAGIPFLHRFDMANTGLTPGHRVLLLDRELSERSLFDRLNQLTDERPGYQLAEDKLLVDHRYQLRLDQPGSSDDLIGLIKENNAEVVVLDTAYKFFSSGDFESSRSLAKFFANIDMAIHETGCSFILTHHQKKGSNAKGEGPNVDSVFGSFLWTGWANGTVLLNFKNRSVSDPYTTIASFTAFRDAPAPEPLLLKRTRDSITYSEIVPYSFDEEEQGHSSPVQVGRVRMSLDTVKDLMMKQVPVIEDEFLHQAAGYFNTRPDAVKLHLLDMLDRKDPHFFRDGKGTRTDPFMWRFRGDKVEETYDAEDPFDEFGQIRGQLNMEEVTV